MRNVPFRNWLNPRHVGGHFQDLSTPEYVSVNPVWHQTQKVCAFRPGAHRVRRYPVSSSAEFAEQQRRRLRARKLLDERGRTVLDRHGLSLISLNL